MKAIASVPAEPSIQLTLTMSEAQWLRAMVQNPMTKDETSDQALFRHMLWDALNHAGVRS